MKKSNSCVSNASAKSEAESIVSRAPEDRHPHLQPAGWMVIEKQHTGPQYCDPKFPATFQSLWGFGESDDPATDKQKYQDFKWCRPSEIFNTDDYSVFDFISPKDIIQGSLGDSNFLASIAAVAENEDRISKLFQQKKKSKSGCYSVGLNLCGEWKEIIVDDQIPCYNGPYPSPVFNRTQGYVLWVMIQEKAYAKYFRGYLNINKGYSAIALNVLTGAPVSSYWINDEKVSDEEKFAHIKDAGELQKIMCVHSGGSLGNFGDKKTGIIHNHAYTLLGAHILKKSGLRWVIAKEYAEKDHIRVIKLRNPYGQTEWNGDWCDKDELWKNIDSKNKKILGKSDAEDGIFYMSFDDFKKHFLMFNICHYHDNYCLSSYRSKTDDDEVLNYEFEIKTEGAYYFSLNQKDERNFKKKEGYRYSKLSMIITCEELDKEGNKHTRLVDSCCGNDYQIFSTGDANPGKLLKDCNPGKYYASIFTPWQANSNIVTFSIYGPTMVQAKQMAPLAMKNTIFVDAFANQAMQDEEDWVTIWANVPEFTTKSHVEKGGFGYTVVKNDDPKRTQYYTLSFNTHKSIHMVGPHKDQFKSITVVLPNDREVIWYRFGPNHSYTLSTFAEIETIEVPLVKKITKNKKVHRTWQGREVGITCYTHYDANGAYFMFKNANKQGKCLIETMNFHLENCKIVGTDLHSFQINVRPHQVKVIVIKSFGGPFEAKITDSSYDVK